MIRAETISRSNMPANNWVLWDQRLVQADFWYQMAAFPPMSDRWISCPLWLVIIDNCSAANVLPLKSFVLRAFVFSLLCLLNFSRRFLSYVCIILLQVSSQVFFQTPLLIHYESTYELTCCMWQFKMLLWRLGKCSPFIDLLVNDSLQATPCQCSMDCRSKRFYCV